MPKAKERPTLKNTFAREFAPEAQAATGETGAVSWPTAEEARAGQSQVGRVLQLPRGEMEPWEGNPRSFRSEEMIARRGEEMRAQGQLQELIIRPHPDPEKVAQGIRWQVIAGVTRWYGSAPEYGDIPLLRCSIRQLDDNQAADVAFMENNGRNAMPALDNARYYKSRLESLGGDEDSYRKLAAKIGTSVSISYERIRQFVNLLDLPAKWIMPVPTMVEGIEKPLPSRFEQLGLSELHGRALLRLQEFPGQQEKLWAAIEDGIIKGLPLSGQATYKRAGEMLDLVREPKPKKPKKDATTGSGSSTGETQPDEKKSPSLDAEVRDEDAAPAPKNGEEVEGDTAPVDDWQSKLRATNAGVGGVGTSAPSSSGVGFATASSEGQNTRGINLNPASSFPPSSATVESTEAATLKKDIIEDALRPGIELLAHAGREINDNAPLDADQQARAHALLKKLHSAVRSVENAIDFSEKLQVIDANYEAKTDEAAT